MREIVSSVTILKCDWCGKKFNPIDNIFDQFEYHIGRYCSKKCMNEELGPDV